jgi:hypothetical protein
VTHGAIYDDVDVVEALTERWQVWGTGSDDASGSLPRLDGPFQ